MNGIVALFGYRFARYVARLGAGVLVAAMVRRLEQRRAMAAADGGRRRVPDAVLAVVPGATLALLRAAIDRSGPRTSRRRRR